MPVLIKLNEARKQFHASKLTKTGENKFAGYKYFELGDFLIPALSIFESLKLNALISFGVELATMTITDLEDGTSALVTSPMSTASLKACHEVQNLGAVQTYLRRYLWVAALEIVEHDALDSSPGADARSSNPEREAQRARWLADQFAAIDAASTVGELKRAVDAAVQTAKAENDAEAESQIHAAAAVKASKARRTKEPV